MYQVTGTTHHQESKPTYKFFRLVTFITFEYSINEKKYFTLLITKPGFGLRKIENEKETVKHTRQHIETTFGIGPQTLVTE